MEFPVRPTTLASQCYPPSSDFILDHRHVLSALRPPLRESTGNAQYHHFQQQQHEEQQLRQQQQQQQQLGALLSIPSPPIIPTPSLSSAYGSPEFLRLQQRHQMQLQRRQHGINPIYLSPQFLSYRKKQANKSKEEKSDQKWPDVLEDAFLDGEDLLNNLVLLQIRWLMQQMGKRKYTMRSKLWGRNMLIAEFLWIAYCASLPPGTEPDPKMKRKRKQVSSHIQVLKNFFLNHRCFHFFFPRQENKEEKNRRRKVVKKQPLSATELKEIESFKKNPVLIALAEGRLPAERPNYEYFAQILALNDQIAIRPKRCWIFVSHPNVTVRGDGSGYLPTTGDRLDKSEYPHLERNLEKEKWAKEEQQIFKGSLLHEFTKEIRQVESSTVREVNRGWETSFPELHERLEAIIAADSRCDYLHINVALELKEKRGFPNQSDFNSWIEINIEQSQLLSHRWKVETKLVRPAELSFVSEKSPPQTYYETGAEIAIQYQHLPGCDGPRNGGGHDHQCDCISAGRRREWVMVPFPADAWARTLTNCAEYPAHPFTGVRRGNKKRMAAAASLKREDSSDDNDDTESTSTRSSVGGDGGQPTQMELVPQIAMLQEIWSCPPEQSSLEQQDGVGAGTASHQQPQWTRRAVILWTFETIHSLDSDGKLVTAQSGKTSWRFLTVLDPTSPYHQQKALLSSSDAAAAGQVIGPNRHTTTTAAGGRTSLSINPHYPGTSHGMGATEAFIPSPISSSMGTTPGMGGRAGDLIMSPASSYQHHLQAAAAGMSDVYNTSASAAASAAATATSAWGGGGGTDTRGSFSSVGSGATHLSSATGYDAQFHMILEHSMRSGGGHAGGHGAAGQRLGSHGGASVHSGLETPPPSATMSNSFHDGTVDLVCYQRVRSILVSGISGIGRLRHC
ncbi:hypothetical protein N0V85_003341 [Neurospora sp. IMI 360204]|nr:hypothetical protein N0V85_003341 [Neurospora sp. IMI 360204]